MQSINKRKLISILHPALIQSQSLSFSLYERSRRMPVTQMRKLSKARLKRTHSLSRKANASTILAPVINVERTHYGRSPVTVSDAIPASAIVTPSTDPAFPKFFFGKSLPTVNVGDVTTPDNVQPPDPRTLKLGKSRCSVFVVSLLSSYAKSKRIYLRAKNVKLNVYVTAIRILHERLPTLLLSPLPQEILSPQITLHLFPSTHPHLPTVSGRIAYTAALWTAPVAWGRIPVIGNVKLEILSERMYRNGAGTGSGGDSAGSMRQERLVVRWRTCEDGKTKAAGGSGGAGSIYGRLRKSQAGSGDGQGGRPQNGDKDDDQDFSGLFLFEFDEHGRILSHTIEHAQEGGNWDKMPRMINVTDWLLEKAWGKKLDEAPALALGYCDVQQDRSRYLKSLVDRER